jgi:DNA-binding SARP family transcriptional activator
VRSSLPRNRSSWRSANPPEARLSVPEGGATVALESPKVEFRILGPLEVVENGKALDLGGQKQRALLAVLLLHAGEVVSGDRLIDALWAEEPPETGRKALQVYVSGLRKLLGRERIETRPPGYRLRLEQGELDLERFSALLEAGEARQALSLWRGPALSDLAYEPFAQAEIARLEELRLACLEQRIDQDLAAGQHAALVGELEALVQEHPLSERLRAQLMLCLYRCDRQAEALEAYQAARAVLVEELGIEPGRPLRELHQAILNQDAALDLELRDTLEESEPAPAPVPPLEPEPMPREVRKVVTVLSAGVTTSTEGGERLDPEALRRVIGRGFADVHAAVERHGGSVETTAGDVVTAVFGIPVVHEDDALRALRAAAEVRERLTGLGEQVQSERSARMELRIGIGTGEVVTGGQLHPIGEPLTAAHRLGRSAEAGEIVLDEATHRLTRHVVTVEPVEGAFRLIEVALEPAGHVSRLDSPMVGRERERRRLQDAFDQAVGDRSCQLFTILGLAGVGKSRLVQEFLGELAGRALVGRGRCLPYGEGITYWPVMEAVKEAAVLDDTEPAEESRRKLAMVVEGEEEAELIGKRVAEVIGLTEATGGAEGSFWAVRRLFETLAQSRALVLVFDDIHWGEPTFLDLVEHLAEWTRDAPILLVCLARPELIDMRPGWGGGKLNATSILLEPLSEQESTQLIDNLAAGAGLDDRARRRIVEAAEGNPLFVEEMLALVLEDERAEGELEMPPTIQALLAARLDRLGDQEQALIAAASVEGKVFHEGSVAELVPDALRPSVHEQLMALVRKELLRPARAVFSGDRAFRFRHLLIRDAAYESVPKEARAEMHERYAGWLEERVGERAVEWEEIIGYHLEQAFRYRAELGPVDEAGRALARRAAERLAAAGHRAFVRTDAPAAVNLISRAVSLLPPDDPARVDLVPTVRVAQGLGGDLGWAVEVLDEAIAAGDERLRAHAIVQRALLRLFTGPDVPAEELIEIAQRAIEVFEGLGDDLGLARAWRLVQQANYLARRAGPSAEAAERALVHARLAGARVEEREIARFLLVALVLGPAAASEAARRCEQLLDEAAGDPVLELDALASLAYFVAIQGRTAEAQELLARGRRVTGELREGLWVPLFYYALFAVWEGDPIAAERELRPGYEALRRIGEKSGFGSLAAGLAQAVYAQGRYDEAQELAEESREASRPIDVQGETAWRTVKAKVLARRGEAEAAEELAREAISFVEQSDFLSAHAEGLTDLAEILRVVGRPDEAPPVLEEALRLYEQKGHVVSAARARALLEGMSHAANP